jgi:uncharacterized protein YjbI with pentapeptide repeats
MANAEQLSRLKQGVKPWNQWREEVQNQWREEVRNQLEALPDGQKEELTQWLADTNNKITITGPDLSGVDLSGADLSEADLSEVNLSGADLTRADLSEVNLSGADLTRANLSGADLSEADLSGLHHRRTRFSKTGVLTGFLSGADLTGADLTRANLSGADLSWANLTRADLSGADLSGANLSSANLSRTNLSRANFRGAKLRMAHLSDSDLSMADFSHADLSGANLSRAHLFRTDFSNTNLVMASFTGADLTMAHFEEADPDHTETTQLPEIEIEIALPQETINQTDIEQLQGAIANLMEVFEFRLKWELEPIQGSWWQTLIFWSKDKTTQLVVSRLLQTLKEVFVARSIGIPSAEETVKLADAVDRVIKCLEPFESGVIRIGNLLVIKRPFRGRNSLRVETIAPSLARKLVENPKLIKSPALILSLVEEQNANIAAQATSNIVPLNEPQGELSSQEPLVQLPSGSTGSHKPSDSNAVL